jgi:NTE family protein
MTPSTLQTDDFTLVLSGGGALGLAHLGVLHDLEQRAWHPSEIVGTSMGGIIGACIAIGMKEAEIHALLKEFAGLSNWLAFSLTGNAFVRGSKIETIFRKIFGDKRFCDTLTPLKLIATDLADGSKRVFGPDEETPLCDALLATMAIPGIFEEQHIGGRIYGDGFLCENLGLREATCTSILAVDVLGRGSFGPELPANRFKTTNMLEMFERSMRLLIHNQTRTALQQCERALVLLEPDTKQYKTYQFHRIDAIREAGLNLIGSV